jgi:hypothetical protein
VIRDAVLHILNEQPLLADLLDPPGPADTILACTNLRALSGKRPVWIDDSASTFYFPMVLIRFVEIHPGTDGVAEHPPARERQDAPPQPPQPPELPPPSLPSPQPEADLEIDEEFLRRVRDV